MFSPKIENSPFTSGDANSFFGEIVYEINSGSDESFLSTLRALLYHRLREAKRTIGIKYSRSSYSKDDVSGISVNRLMSYAISGNFADANDTIFIHNVDGTAPDRNATIKIIQDKFLSYYSDYGFERIQKVTDFFRKSFAVMCFVNPSKRTVVLIVDRLTMRKLHAIQAAIFAFLPWYFDPEQGIAEDEMALIYALQEKTPDKYIEVINRMFSKYDIRSEIIKSKLAGFESEYEKREIRNIESDINNYNVTIDDALNRISEYTKRLSMKQLVLAALKEKVDNPTNEIMEYFLHNKNLVLQNVNGTTIRFAIKTYLAYFDEEYAKKIINNECSTIYSYINNSGISREDYKMLMEAIFVDQIVRVRMCATFKIAFGGVFEALSGCTYPSGEFGTYTPNPHLHHHHCMGNNRRAIAECLKNNNLIGAIEQCCASAADLNLTDSIVLGDFMRSLCGHRSGININCIELPDGNIVKPKQAIAWLKQQ